MNDFIMHLMPVCFSRFKAEADLNTFHSLGTHNGLCELPVEFPVPMNIAPQAGWQAGDNNFVDTPQRGALLSPDFNLFPHLVTEMRSEERRVGKECRSREVAEH